jgi:hypothetical protein
VDARSHRKRRQLSSASYYISNVNPYSSSYDPTVPLTYPSGSYYSAPGYGYPNTGYSGDRPYDPNYSDMGSYQYDSSYPYGLGQAYQFQNLGSTYGSGQYMPYVPGLTGYGIAGSNTLYANWNQGNNYQYYTGGTGTGLVNTGYPWYRSRQNIPYQGQVGENPAGQNPPIGMNPPVGLNPAFNPNSPVGFNQPPGPNVPVGFNPPRPMKKSAPVRSSGN